MCLVLEERAWENTTLLFPLYGLYCNGYHGLSS